MVGRPKKSEIKDTRKTLLEVAIDLFRTNGYGSTSIDAICVKAGIKKGTFFHYFRTKEELAVETTKYWSTFNFEVFKDAHYLRLSDPLARLNGYLNFRIKLLMDESTELSCLIGTLAQEIHASKPGIRIACGECIISYGAKLENDFAAIRDKYAPKSNWKPSELASHVEAVIQGAIVIAKATDDRNRAADSIRHLKKYIQLLIERNETGLS